MKLIILLVSMCICVSACVSGIDVNNCNTIYEDSLHDKCEAQKCVVNFFNEIKEKCNNRNCMYEKIPNNSCQYNLNLKKYSFCLLEEYKHERKLFGVLDSYQHSSKCMLNVVSELGKCSSGFGTCLENVISNSKCYHTINSDIVNVCNKLDRIGVYSDISSFMIITIPASILIFYAVYVFL